MLVLTEDAVLVCKHENGVIDIEATQKLVTVQGRRMLVDDNPEKRGIRGCPSFNPLAGIRPCNRTLAVKVGYSQFIRIEGKRVCLDSVRGLTDGTPPGFIEYKVRSAGQPFVSSTA